MRSNGSAVNSQRFVQPLAILVKQVLLAILVTTVAGVAVLSIEYGFFARERAPSPSPVAEPKPKMQAGVQLREDNAHEVAELGSSSEPKSKEIEGEIEKQEGVMPLVGSDNQIGAKGGDALPSSTLTTTILESSPSITPLTATKNQPYTNSLGMKFVPVPRTGVLFSIWETRTQDYKAYEAANAGIDLPVVGVSWNDANEFCDWLSRKEGQRYRLPTIGEWEIAAGAENQFYPWGNTWPPPEGSGNFQGKEGAASRPYGVRLPTLAISGYSDSYEKLAPVASYSSNKFGVV